MFYIVSGELNVYVDGKVFRVSAGEFMFLPRGVPSDFDGGCAQTALGHGVMAVCSDARQTVNRRCDFASKCRRGVDVGFAPAVLACPRRGCFDGKSGET
jgi:cupin domain